MVTVSLKRRKSPSAAFRSNCHNPLVPLPRALRSRPVFSGSPRRGGRCLFSQVLIPRWVCWDKNVWDSPLLRASPQPFLLLTASNLSSGSQLPLRNRAAQEGGRPSDVIAANHIHAQLLTHAKPRSKMFR